MSKSCARCEKTVYPIEELKCLDKIWHKGCFKCQGCGMTLNMRTYKGFNKQPYCEAHIPKVKATTMAETPELKRIAENTKIQSNVKYHADFEKSKGKFTQVADDPETLRIKQNSKIISNVAYHGDLEKKAAMEQKRTLNENGDYVDVPEEINTHINKPQHHQTSHAPSSLHHAQPQSQSHHHNSHVATSQTPITNNQHHQQHQHQHQHQQVNNHHQTSHYQTPTNMNNPSAVFVQHEQSTIANQQGGYASNVPTSSYHHGYPPGAQTPTHGGHHHAGHGGIGKISDYDPLTDQPRNSPYSARQSSTVIYTSNQGAVTNPPQRRIGSVSDLDPVNDVYGSLSNDYRGGNANHHQQQYTNNHHSNVVQQNTQQPPPPSTQNANNLTGRVYRALYDYEAQDADEVSFLDGDLIVQAASVDAGWMTGTVQRTGRTGMLPANYVERVVI
ncbi:LIM and SH3 domain protein Lasp [Chrysoperla carnea]|uniref:LIM and SH3 domain protein Lasp n=1 Tax=Chrysoperla carnea TaxID=189513 RepID=UPI001D08F17A|nr:LIM and SH3 domain protein Lasp [Chrysoperla carnea]